VHIPIPVLSTSSGQASSTYDECRPRRCRHRKPTAIVVNPRKNTRRRPSFGKYQKENPDRRVSPTTSGVNAIAVCSDV